MTMTETIIKVEHKAIPAILRVTYSALFFRFPRLRELRNVGPGAPLSKLISAFSPRILLIRCDKILAFQMLKANYLQVIKLCNSSFLERFQIMNEQLHFD